MAELSELKNVKVFLHDCFSDNRGELFTIWQQSETKELLFNHDKVAVSHKNVLRGLHTDTAWKLITCLHGKIQLVIVNFKQDSSEFLDHQSIILDSDSNIKTTVLVPPGFLNGHLVLSNEAIFYYKWAYEGNYPDVNDQMSVSWCDPKIGIKWLSDSTILSERDQKTQLL